MLELSMTLPIKVQNGGLFISRGVGRHPARRLESWEIIFVEKGRLTIQEEERIFLVDAGEFITLAEPTTCWGGGFSRRSQILLAAF